MHGLVLLVAVLAGVAEANLEKTFVLPGGATIRNLSVPNPTPPHQVTLTHGFWMGKYKLTTRQWDVVADLDLPEDFESPPQDEWG